MEKAPTFQAQVQLYLFHFAALGYILQDHLRIVKHLASENRHIALLKHLQIRNYSEYTSLPQVAIPEAIQYVHFHE